MSLGMTTADLGVLCAAMAPGLHEGGPESSWEIALVVVGLLIVVIALVQAVRFLFWPGERAAGHIKRAVLDDSAPSAKVER